MDKFGHLFLLCGLLLLLSLTLSSINNLTLSHTKLRSTRSSTNRNVTETKTSNISSSNSAENTSSNITTSNHKEDNSTSPESHQRFTNVTNSDALQSSTVPSPATQTMSTTAKITTTDKKHTTQSASKPTATMTTTPILSSPVTTVSNGSTSNTTLAHLTTKTTLDIKTDNETEGPGLNHSEISITILFSVVLGVIVLIVLGQFVYKVSRNKQRRVQYSHRPLYTDSTGEQADLPEDTLVISGGLYDGPQIYNPTVTVLNDEDQPTFSYTPTHLRLEFLHDDQGADHEQ